MIFSSEVRKDANHKSLSALGRNVDTSRKNKKKIKEGMNISKQNLESLDKGKNICHAEIQENIGNSCKSGEGRRCSFI